MGGHRDAVPICEMDTLGAPSPVLLQPQLPLWAGPGLVVPAPQGCGEDDGHHWGTQPWEFRGLTCSLYRSFLDCVALAQPLALLWPPFPYMENRLGPCVVPGIRTPSESLLGPVALGRGADSGLGPGGPGFPAGPLWSWMVAWAPDLASLSLFLSPPLKDGADCPCVAESW